MNCFRKQDHVALTVVKAFIWDMIGFFKHIREKLCPSCPATHIFCIMPDTLSLIYCMYTIKHSRER